MDCPKCGYALTDFDLECPRCKRMGQQAARQQPAAEQPESQPPQDLTAYVAEARAGGVTDDAIRRQLLESGWPAAVVDGHLQGSAAIPQAPPAGHKGAAGAPFPPNYGLGVAGVFACLGAVALSILIAGASGSWCLVLGTVLWMGVDASRLKGQGYAVPGFSPTVAVLGGLLLWVIALPWYIVARDSLTRQLRQMGAQPAGPGALFAYAGASLVVALMLNAGLNSLVAIGNGVDTTVEPIGRTAPSPAVPAATSRTWQRVASWTGDGIKSTPSFTVGDEWAIEWATQPGQFGAMNFQIYTYTSDGQLSDVDANIIGAGGDTSYKHTAGTYYLQVNSAQHWQVSIWDKK